MFNHCKQLITDSSDSAKKRRGPAGIHTVVVIKFYVKTRKSSEPPSCSERGATPRPLTGMNPAPSTAEQCDIKPLRKLSVYNNIS